MAISSNFIGNLLGRHLKYDLGSGSTQAYNSTTGRGYVFSADGRVGFFVDFNQTDPKYAVSYSAALSSGDALSRKTAADTFVNLPSTSPFNFPTTSATSSIFHKAFDTRIVSFDSSSIGTLLAEKGLGKSDFSNTAILLETWIDGILENAGTADVSATGGIRGFITGAARANKYMLWSEMTPSTATTASSTSTAPTSTVMTTSSESLMMMDPGVLTTAQKFMFIDGREGFDYLGLLFTPTSGITANFSNTEAQTIIYAGHTYKVKNFEGMDLTDFDDNFIGSAFDNTVYASKGTDIINGGGTWTDGYSTDRDWVQYINGSGGVTVNTNSSGVMTVKDYSGSIDTLTNIEAVGGTYFIDRMYGGTGNYNQIFAGNKGGDFIDGGAGRDDRVWHGDDASGVVVNLSGKTVNTQAVKQFANSLKYAGVEGFLSSVYIMKEAFDNLDTPSVKSVASNRALDGWGSVDSLVNIEAAQGSAFDDQLYGSNDRNILSGGDGFDFIVGNGGDDYITGGLGHDSLYGGLGRDWIVMDELNWGKLTPMAGVNRYVRDLDMSGNLVVYKSVIESTTQNADVIDGFVLGDDLIDLTSIDANTKRSGNQDFSGSILFNVAWTKTAGQLRVSEFTGASAIVDNHNFAVSNATGGYRLSGVQLEGDVNGDGVADFAIKLVGVTLASAQSLISTSILF